MGQNELKDVAGLSSFTCLQFLKKEGITLLKRWHLQLVFFFFSKIFLNSDLLDKGFLTNLVATLFSVLFSS